MKHLQDIEVTVSSPCKSWGALESPSTSCFTWLPAAPLVVSVCLKLSYVKVSWFLLISQASHWPFMSQSTARRKGRAVGFGKQWRQSSGGEGGRLTHTGVGEGRLEHREETW